MTVRTVTRWWCTGCDAGDATVPGADQPTRAKLDRAAERHTKSTGHTTHFRQTPDSDSHVSTAKSRGAIQ